MMLSPSSSISPLFISYAGFPIRVKPRVDFPAPLGPISTWVSPAPIVKSIFLRISVSSIATDKFLTFNNSDIMPPNI